MPAHGWAKGSATLRDAGERIVAEALIAVVEPIDTDRWNHVPHPGVWSIGKDAEHVAEAAIYHQWIVRLTIGQPVSSRRPAIERDQMTTHRSPSEVVELLRVRTEDGARLLLDLTDAQLHLPDAAAASSDAGPRRHDRTCADRPFRGPPCGDRGQASVGALASVART